MKEYIFIGIGGFIGAVSRYSLKNIRICGYHGNFPLNTLIINIAGSFLLALILVAVLEIPKFNKCIKTGLTIGFLGAFTTFSTFCRETVELLTNDHYFIALFYVGLTILVGLAAAWLGTFVAVKLTAGCSNSET